jgi:serine protease AprX
MFDKNVHSLIYNSKKILNIDSLIQYVNFTNNHTCVVIDTGIYPHIDFCLGKNRIVGFVDLINDSSTPYDDNGHGTFIAGVLCGNSIIDKYQGIDNMCNIIVIKALDNVGETSTLMILQAVKWIVKNKEKYDIKVVCMSFGSELMKASDPLISGAEVLWDNGIVVVCAGGNSGPQSGTIMSPGASRKIITVGSLDNTERDFGVADFSSRGPVLGNYKPDLVVPGVKIISTNVFSKDKKFYTRMSGTSVSTPMVAGVVSLLLKVNPKYTPNQIKYMLVNSCISSTGDRNSEGFGRLDLSRLKLL